MPINMMTGEKYNIDYEKMRIELMEMSIFHNKQIQKLYVDKWITELMEADKTSTNMYFDPANKVNIVQEKLEAPETFHTLVKYKNNNMYIHFRVSRINQLIKMQGLTESDAQEIGIEEFEQRINWTETDKLVERGDPIIIVPFTIGRYLKELVVDGNHRVTTAIKNKKKSIKAFPVSAQWLVDNNLFSTSFDKLLYIFQNEVVWIGSFYNQMVADERILIAHSYFSSGEVKVS